MSGRAIRLGERGAHERKVGFARQCSLSFSNPKRRTRSKTRLRSGSVRADVGRAASSARELRFGSCDSALRPRLQKLR
nr:MAG: hypothetical protein DIU78_23840 [Pseudomonadota bacterium]